MTFNLYLQYKETAKYRHAQKIDFRKSKNTKKKERLIMQRSSTSLVFEKVKRKKEKSKETLIVLHASENSLIGLNFFSTLQINLLSKFENIFLDK
jgi:hypothetical protein